MLLHKDDLYSLVEALQEMFDLCVRVMQFAIQDGEICRLEKSNDYIWFSTYIGTLDRCDLEPEELVDMAAHYDDAAGPMAARSDELIHMRDVASTYPSYPTKERFLDICNAIIGYYKAYHYIEDGDLYFLYDQVQKLLCTDESGDLDWEAIK